MENVFSQLYVLWCVEEMKNISCAVDLAPILVIIIPPGLTVDIFQQNVLKDVSASLVLSEALMGLAYFQETALKYAENMKSLKNVVQVVQFPVQT